MVLRVQHKSKNVEIDSQSEHNTGQKGQKANNWVGHAIRILAISHYTSAMHEDRIIFLFWLEIITRNVLYLGSYNLLDI